MQKDMRFSYFVVPPRERGTQVNNERVVGLIIDGSLLILFSEKTSF